MASKIEIRRSQLARGRIVRALSTAFPEWTGLGLLRATVSSAVPGDDEHVSETDLERLLGYLEAAGFVESEERESTFDWSKTRFVRLTASGMDLWEGRTESSGVLILR